MKSNSFNDSNDYLPSPSGQRSEMPPKTPPAHPLGPYAPRPCGNMMANAADEAWLPSPSGQLPNMAYGSNKNQDNMAHSAPAEKGNSTDEVALPMPNGQYRGTPNVGSGSKDSGPR